jgi:hypothetical protein
MRRHPRGHGVGTRTTPSADRLGSGLEGRNVQRCYSSVVKVVDLFRSVGWLYGPTVSLNRSV